MSYGEISLKKFLELNATLVCKQAWHVILKPHSLMSKVFITEYGKGSVENYFKIRPILLESSEESVEFFLFFILFISFLSIVSGK